MRALGCAFKRALPKVNAAARYSQGLKEIFGLATMAHRMGLMGTAFLLATSAAHAADSVSASSQNGYSRLSFAFAPSGHVTAVTDGSVLTLSFDR